MLAALEYDPRQSDHPAPCVGVRKKSIIGEWIDFQRDPLFRCK